MIEHWVLAIYHFFEHLGIWGVFLSMFIENIGVPLPTEVGYLIGQNLVANGTYSYLMMLFVLTAGHVAGSLISYRIGLWGDNFVSRRIKKSKKIVEVHNKLIKWYERWGNWTVFLTRFVGYVRPWSSYVAGFAEVKFFPFLILTTLGSLIFNIINIYLGGVFILIWRKFVPYHFAIITILFLVFFGAILWGLVKSLARNRRK